MQWPKVIILLSFFCGCVSDWGMVEGLTYRPIMAGKYQLATFVRLSDATTPVHIYIEGDGNSFDARGRPTSDPTPRSTFVRDLASRDTSPNVVYMARPCQYIMSPACRVTDWTDGRFSSDIIDSVSLAIKTVAENRPVVLIGYSGGAMVSGLVISRNSGLDIEKWITIAGVLNHTDWTGYFGDVALGESLDLETLPSVPQLHYIAKYDRVVPNDLSYQWLPMDKIIVEKDANHTNFPNINILF